MRHQWEHGIEKSICRRCEETANFRSIRRGSTHPCFFPADIIETALLCVGIEIPKAILNSWTNHQTEQAFNWASRLHLAASDNNIRIPPKPDFIGEGIQRKCRICGCTDDHACPGGCYWIENDLCSACSEKARKKKKAKK